MTSAERVGRYQLLEPIGVGPSGAVSRAKVFGVAGFERQFAVKRFHNELTTTPALAQSLSAAARGYGSLEHPRIARMSEFGVAQGMTFTAVEYVAGLDALRLVAEARLAGHSLATGGSLALVSQAARAVGYAHGRGLTHLGLSPTNVIVTAEGDIKITDFGILSATLPQRPVEATRLSHRIQYLAPEQLAGEATSAATDVFALGVLAYELVTGQRTFRGETPQQIAQAVMAGPPAEPPLPRPIVRVLQRCLARSPFERFPDARALADALDAALRVAPVPGTRKDVGAQVKETLDRLAALREGDMSGVVALNVGTGPVRRPDSGPVATAPREVNENLATFELPRPHGASPASTVPDLPKAAMTTVPGLPPPPIPVPPGLQPPGAPRPGPAGSPTTLVGLAAKPPPIPPIRPRMPIPRLDSSPLASESGAIPPLPRPPDVERPRVATPPSGVPMIAQTARLERAPTPPPLPRAPTPVPIERHERAPTPLPIERPAIGDLGADSAPRIGTDLEVPVEPVPAALTAETNGESPELTIEEPYDDAPIEIDPGGGLFDQTNDRHTNEIPTTMGDKLNEAATRSTAEVAQLQDVWRQPAARDDRASDGVPAEQPAEVPVDAPMFPSTTLIGVTPAPSSQIPLAPPSHVPPPEQAHPSQFPPPDRGPPPVYPPPADPRLPGSRSRLPLIVGGVIAAGALGVAGWVVYGALTAEPGASEVAGRRDAGAIDTTKIAIVPAADAEPAAADAIAAAPADAVIATTQADAAAAPEDAVVATAPADAGPKPSTGDVLAISSTPPGARVFLDGSDAGVTPLKLPGTPDRHTIGLLLAGHELYIAQVDGHGTFAIPLKEVTPSAGPAGIKVTKCKEKERYYVFVDGKPTGQTCPTERIETDLGPHTVEVYDVVSETRKKWEIDVKDTRLSYRVRID